MTEPELALRLGEGGYADLDTEAVVKADRERAQVLEALCFEPLAADEVAEMTELPPATRHPRPLVAERNETRSDRLLDLAAGRRIPAQGEA